MEIIKKYIDKFNMNDEEIHINSVSNKDVYNWLCEEIPLFECPDKDIEETYYFRWWTYRKHIKKTEEGIIITEFLPQVPWGGKYNEINAAVGHHLYEGRWLKNSSKYLVDYINFFLNHSKRGHQYSAWLIYAIYQMCLVTDNWNICDDFLKKACTYYEEWENTHLLNNGLFWSYDNNDAMEFSISGTTDDLRCIKGIRPTLNSYMCADAWAISKFAERFGNKEIADRYFEKHKKLKKSINEKLWQDGFYRAFHFEDGCESKSCDEIIEGWRTNSPKELIGYIPWMFNIPDETRTDVFGYLADDNIFFTEYGLTTAEKKASRFLFEDDHECLWNGYVWPFATAQTLTAMRNVIMNYESGKKYKDDFITLVRQYAISQKRITEEGKVVNWIDEVRHPEKDLWSSREILKNFGWESIRGGYERGKDYNHSTFCDIIISGIVGVNYHKATLEVIPTIPDDWDYFRLDNLHFRGNTYSIIYDKTGTKYNQGKGLTIICNR